MKITSGTHLLLKMLIDTMPLDSLADHGVQEDHFFSEEDVSLYGHICNHHNQYGKLPSLISLSSTFPELRNIKLPDEPFTYFVDSFKDRVVKEAVRHGYSKLEDIINSDKPISEIVGMLNNISTFIGTVTHGSSNFDATYELSVAFLMALDKAMVRRRASDVITGASFGFDFLDIVTDGGQDGDFISLSGRPGNGKTHILLNSANATYDQGKCVAIATFEMPVEQIARRLIERRLNIPSKYLKFGKFGYLAEKTINQHVVELKGKEGAGHALYIYQGQLLTKTGSLRSMLDKVKPEALYVDGAYNMKINNSRKGKWEQVSEGAEFLKDVALTDKIPVFASYQLNRQGKGSKGSGDNIMYSDSIFQLASIAITILNPEETKTDTSSSWGGSLRRILKIDKGRDGEAAVVEAELSFGHKPFRVVRVISGDLRHIGYGVGNENLGDIGDFSLA